MQMEQQVTLDSGACLHPENVLLKDRDHGVTTFSLDHVMAQQPVKKQTRQWAAWTRQEEESFFAALRQVGKNFEKITCRVQSKNKDQVRHYYYRLVRRMNKLLGPDLYLDAKNSKDTNAAMLRWWSLLEKYSCKASKLHLKPRRLKIFIENLEHQLLKDRKKNVRKRPSQGEHSSITEQGRVAGHDTRSIKMVVVDGQSIPKLGSAKGSSLKRNANIGINRISCKGDSSPVKTARHRRKQGVVSTTAYKRWEKAAIAGVSLVADAAEHLERTATGVVEEVQSTQGPTTFDSVEKDGPILQISSQNLFLENTLQNSMKLKLQLFPIDEYTRRALEMDNHNPHLELTLSTRKKISSVVEHLNRKWGSSSIATGELTLLPYYVQRENLVGNQRWTKDSVLNAADVYALIGSPSVFRLRYGWFSNSELGLATCQPPLVSSTHIDRHDVSMNIMREQNLDGVPVSMPSTNCKPKALISSYKDQVALLANIDSPVPSSKDKPSEVIGCASTDPTNNVLESSDSAPTTSCQRKEMGNGAAIRQVANTDDLRTSNYTALSVGEWADSLTNVSVGDLLSDTSHNVVAGCVQQSLPDASQCLPQVPFSCDSFDAAIAAHICKHQVKTGSQEAVASHASSIWDAEETCDAFAFQENYVFCEKVQGVSTGVSPDAYKQMVRTSSGATDAELPEAMEPLDGDPSIGEPVDEFQSDLCILANSAKDLSALTDIYWPESLGPLDLDITPCRYHSDDLILSDSLSGLNRLIASSLDAFQNCSFFGFDKKEPASTVEAQENDSFSDFKIHSEV